MKDKFILCKGSHYEDPSNFFQFPFYFKKEMPLIEIASHMYLIEN